MQENTLKDGNSLQQSGERIKRAGKALPCFAIYERRNRPRLRLVPRPAVGR